MARFLLLEQRELAKLATLQAEHDTAKTRMQHLARENSGLAASVESARLAGDRLLAGKSALEEEVLVIGPLGERAAKLQGEVSSAVSQMEGARSELQRERVEWQTCRDAHALELRTLRQDMSLANARVIELQGKLDTLSQTQAEVSEQLAASSAGEQAAVAKVAELRQRQRQDAADTAQEHATQTQLLKASLLSESTAHAAAQRQLAASALTLHSALSDLEASRRLVDLGREARNATVQELQHTHTLMLAATASATKLQEELQESTQLRILAQQQRADAAAAAEELKAQLLHATHAARVAQLGHDAALLEERAKCRDAVDTLEITIEEFQRHFGWMQQTCVGRVRELEGKACEHVKQMVFQARALDRRLTVSSYPCVLCVFLCVSLHHVPVFLCVSLHHIPVFFVCLYIVSLCTLCVFTCLYVSVSVRLRIVCAWNSTT